MVERSDHVMIGERLPASFTAYACYRLRRSTHTLYHNELVCVSDAPVCAVSLLPLLLRVTRTYDHLVRRLVLAVAGALGRLAPRGHRVAAARGAAFAAAMRVVDRILGDAAGQRALA